MGLVSDYVVSRGIPVRCRPLWIARDLEDEYGKEHLEQFRSTPTIKTSIQLCLGAMGYVNEGVGGSRVWIREDHLIVPEGKVI